jgi:hypothetical protein
MWCLYFTTLPISRSSPVKELPHWIKFFCCFFTLCCRLWYLCWWKFLSNCLRVSYDYREHSSINKAHGFLGLFCSQFPDLKIVILIYLKFLSILWVIPIEFKIILLLCTHYECNVFFFIFSLLVFWKKTKPTSNLLHPLRINTYWWHGWSAFLCV